MSNQPAPAPHHPAESKWRILALVLLPIVGILLVLLAIFLVRPRDAGVVTVVYRRRTRRHDHQHRRCH